MKLPRTINLSGYEIKIRHVKRIFTDKTDCYGMWSASDKTIRLVYGMSKTRKKEIFLHEFIHAITDVYRIKMSEETVGNLARALLHIITIYKINLIE